jgi:uncharacterized protein YndB with AHSA1/START domain
VRTDRASRLIRAPLAQVYGAFVDAEALVRWLPPEGMTGEILDFDPVPGGGYRMALTYQGEAHVAGKSSEHGDVVAARFLALVPNRKIIQSAEFESDDPAFAGTMVMTWTFEAAAGGATRVAIVCDNVPGGIRKQDHDAGLKSSLANLARFVE